MPVNMGGYEMGSIGARYLIENSIVTDSLYAYWDAGISASYPGSGSTWFDISGNGRNISLGAGVSLVSNFGGVLQFAKGEIGFGRIAGSSFNLSSSNNTIISFVRKLTVGDSGRTITAWDNNWLLAHHDTTYGDYYAEGWVYGGAGTSDTTWRMFTGTGNVSTDTWQLYINATLTASNSEGAQGPNGLNLNAQYDQFSTCQISQILAYSRVLTASEITQIFNTFRKRYSI